jgi:hypothetical protein
MLPARERRKAKRGDRQIEFCLCLEGFEKWRYQRVGFFNVNVNSLVWFGLEIL